MELALLPFIFPLLLIGRVVDAWQAHVAERQTTPDPKAWEATWFRLQGRPSAVRALADREHPSREHPSREHPSREHP